MCGIVGMWNREGCFSVENFDKLMLQAEERGQDSWGFCAIDKDMRSLFEWGTNSYSVDRDKFLKDKEVHEGEIWLGICRAQPETEVKSIDATSLQPIVKDDIVLIHNGVVSNDCYKKFEHMGYRTKIDSEAIINAYLWRGRNIRMAMKELSGGFAFILVDMKTKRMYCVNDFKPLAIGYVKGKGFLVHSQESAIQKVVEDITDCKRCGTNVWEDFYYHWQDGYTIREIDLDSGMERLYSFEGNFKHPVWKKENNGKELVIVSASGGIDSGLTAFVLKKLGYDVMLVHFDYGQKGELAENIGVQILGAKIKVPVELIDLKGLFAKDTSMLIRKDVKVTTGTSDDIKTTMAWVSNRNGVFLAQLVCWAEQFILSNDYSKVYIASGMSNLSEEGFYPDNSEMFIDAFFDGVRYSTIVGKRIEYLPVMQSIMKSEEWLLGDKLGFPFELTVSCDEPRIGANGDIELCNQCGSTLLSKWAAEMAGVKDPRKFYDIVGSNVNIMEKKFSGKVKKIDVVDVIKRLKLPKDEDFGKLEVLCGFSKAS